ncbi:MAG TPA: DMT family protein [Candidatus Angelobacter sp.]
MKIILVPLMLFAAGLLMSFAWIGHLKFKSLSFLAALAISWSIVLPEYILNVFSVRWGRGQFSGAQMAAIHLGSGVICVVLIARLFLGETLSWSQFAGFAMMAVALALILIKP